MTDEQRLQMITDQLILVRDNLFRGMSKSIQKLQARSINEVLELETFIRSAPDLQAELDATNRQVEILSDALAESRREIDALVALARADERKDIALLVEQMGIDGFGTLAIAAAIRVRSEK
jgi:hypothetical protein